MQEEYSARLLLSEGRIRFLEKRIAAMEDERNAENRVGSSMAAGGGGKMGSVGGYTTGISDEHREFEAASYTAGGGGRMPPTSDATNDRRMMHAAGVPSSLPLPDSLLSPSPSSWSAHVFPCEYEFLSCNNGTASDRWTASASKSPSKDTRPRAHANISHIKQSSSYPGAHALVGAGAGSDISGVSHFPTGSVHPTPALHPCCCL